jgi:hypothetical protein
MRNFFIGKTKRWLFLLFIGISVVALSFEARAQENKVPEPETIGVMYWLDQVNDALVPLDREITSIKAAPGFFKAKAKLRVNGARARLRLNDPKPEFIIQLANGVDPNKIKLYLLSVEGGKRTTVVATATAFSGVKSQLQTLSFDVTKYGQNSYKLTPAQALVPGEYVFNATDSNDAFCFGIDASSKLPE